MNHIPESLEIPAGYKFGAVASGIKKSGKLDLSVMVASHPCHTFGSFTRNVVRASSVDWNSENVGVNQALVINSGNANACTGQQGAQDTADMARKLASLLNCRDTDVCVMSTGIIGEPMPMGIIESGIESVFAKLETTEASARAFADGIMTTDTFPKIVSRKFTVDGHEYRLLGMAKGAGMIGPKMATMLCLLVTDFPLDSTNPNRTQFQQVIDRTFNCIGVDGHTSTSDQVLLFAAQPDPDSLAEPAPFFRELDSTCEELAKLIPSDGEGATHLITIEVEGSQTVEELKVVAKTIADSPLVKTAVFGADPNWGRIVSAAGYSGVTFDPAETSLWVNEHLLFEAGTPVEFDAKLVSDSIKDSFDTSIQLRLCESSNDLNVAHFWTSDLTYDYVKINAEYHT